jgi:hypothetical protein
MRFSLWIAVLLVVCLAAAGAWAFVATKANISKENAYAVLNTPAASAMISKENGYAVLNTPAASVVISKMNVYAVVQLQRPPTVQIIN